jgi:hypothetical protein
MGWRVTVRSAGRVRHEPAPSPDAAVALAWERTRELAAQADGRDVNALGRRYEAADVVAGRVELRGPQRLRPDVRAGFDVRGDGGVVAWNGREPLEPDGREEPVQTLRRALGLGG